MSRDADNSAGKQDDVPLIQLRIPGPWQEPGELADALARVRRGWQLGDGALVHEKTERRAPFTVTEHDDELGDVFRSGHNGRMTDEEVDRVESHAVKIHITTPGGSEEGARLAVDAAAALIRAGGFGVFVDNSGACHGPVDFLKLAKDPHPGGLYWVFVILMGGRDGISSVGMHCLGLRDCRLTDPPDDPELAAFAIHNFLGYTWQSGALVKDGDVLAGPDGPLFHVFHEPCTQFHGSPMHNPYGMWRLEPVLDGLVGGKGPPM